MNNKHENASLDYLLIIMAVSVNMIEPAGKCNLFIMWRKNDINMTG